MKPCSLPTCWCNGRVLEIPKCCKSYFRDLVRFLTGSIGLGMVCPGVQENFQRKFDSNETLRAGSLIHASLGEYLEPA